MPFQVIPRGSDFYELFERAADGVADGASLLAKLLNDFDDPETAHAELRELEHEGDETTHQILRELNTSFVTPFDREDIHALTEAIDDVVDDTEAVSDLLLLHNVEELLPEIKELVDILVRAAERCASLVSKLERLKDLNVDLEDIDRLESDGDRVYRRAVATLFGGDYKAREVLRWKDIVEAIERAVNGIEDISDVVEAIALKHA